MIKTTGKGTDVKTGHLVEQEYLSKNSLTQKHIVGAVVYQDTLFGFDPTLRAFVNPIFGAAMNQDVSFTGTPELIFDGAGAGWVASIISGAWNFTDAGKVTITSANDNDAAIWEDAGTIDMGLFTALTGKVDLDTYDPGSNSIIVQFGLAGSPVGNSINLNDFIDTGIFTEQNFAVQKADFGLESGTVDELTITILRTGGARPDIKFDDFQIEENGNPLVFTVFVDKEEIFCIQQLDVLIADNITGITPVAGATENATVTNLSFDKFLGLNQLSVGVIFNRVQNEEIVIATRFRDVADIMFFSKITNHIADGVNSLVTFTVNFEDPIILDGKTSDRLIFVINDNMSGLLRFNALARGSLRIDPTKK